MRLKRRISGEKDRSKGFISGFRRFGCGVVKLGVALSGVAWSGAVSLSIAGSREVKCSRASYGDAPSGEVRFRFL